MTEVTWRSHTTLVLSPRLLQEVRTVCLSDLRFFFWRGGSAVTLLTRSSVLRVPMFVYQEENSAPLFGWAGDYCWISRIRLWSFRSSHIRSPFQVHCWRSPFAMHLWSSSSVRTSVRVFNLPGAVLESFMLQSREHCRRWWNQWPFPPHGTFMYIYGHFICCPGGQFTTPRRSLQVERPAQGHRACVLSWRQLYAGFGASIHPGGLFYYSAVSSSP